MFKFLSIFGQFVKRGFLFLPIFTIILDNTIVRKGSTSESWLRKAIGAKVFIDTMLASCRIRIHLRTIHWEEEKR
jgi:hypothetical protein